MNAPNRLAEVKAICAQYPAAFPQNEGNDAARLDLLRAVIVPTLNQLDGGRWGLLTKTDQRVGDGFKIPCDILVWRDTLQVFDCMTGSGACWIEHAPPPPQWVWTEVKGADPAPGPGPAPDPGPDPTPTPVPVPSESPTVLFAVNLGWLAGTLAPESDGLCSLSVSNGDIVSLQPDGRTEWRREVGAWEKARRVGPNLLRYDGTGKRYYLLIYAVTNP